MSLIFKDTPISINGTTLHANQGSISDSLSIARVPSLGQSFSFADVYSDKPVGQFTATYYLHDNDNSIRNLIGAREQFIEGTIGELGFTKGVLNSYSLSAEPESLVTATVGITFYQIIEAVSKAGSPTEKDYAHGQRTNIDAIDPVPEGQTDAFLLFNDKLFSFEYSISQTSSPFYFLGNTEVSVADFVEGSVNVSLEGYGLDGAITYPCLDKYSVDIVLRNICGTSRGKISESNLNVDSSELSLSEREGLVGSITLSKNL